MFYEEKWIDGYLCFRLSPNEDFKKLSLEAINERLKDRDIEIEGLKVEIQRCYEALDSRKVISNL